MATNSQLIRKLATGQVLIESEIQQLERAASAWDLSGNFSSTSQEGIGNIIAGDIQAHSAFFDISPVDFVGFQNPLAGNTISNNIETAVTWRTDFPVWKSGISKTLRLRDTDPTKIDILYPSRLWCVFGQAQWTAHATGRRAMAVNLYAADGTQLAGTTLHNFKPNGTTDDVFPGMTWMYSTQDNDASYFTVTVYQNSGGSLDLPYCEAGFFLLR